MKNVVVTNKFLLLLVSLAFIASGCSSDTSTGVDDSNGTNITPTAVDDSGYSTDRFSSIIISVLDNDMGLDNTPLHVEIFQPASNGTTQVQADGTIEYTPSGAYFGDESFIYKITDADGDIATAMVSLQVTCASCGGTGDGIEKAMSINLTTAGRVGFYIDYSERTSPGEHKFYVARTHGTEGEVSVDYATLGDVHTTTSGTLTWADGAADIKYFYVTVPSKTAGEHRMYAQLSNPTNGAVLHFGDYTRAYGVIDDGTIASDSDAVFYDADAVMNGVGTQASPYDNIYDALNNVGSKRYVYGKGVTIPNGTHTCSPGGSGAADCIKIFIHRESEEERLYIRNWPGFTWAVDGGGSTTSAGFYVAWGQSYHTYKGIDFQNLNASAAVNTNGFGIFYRYGGSIGINIEGSTADNINGASGNNNGAYMLWGVDGAKVWRSTTNNIQTNGDNTNGNTAGVYSYDGKNISVQRSEMTNSHNSIYHKRTVLGDVSTSVRFNILNTANGVHYGASGGSGVSHSFTVVQSNIFKGCAKSGIDHWPGSNDIFMGEKHWWVSNVFDGCGSGERAAITFKQGYSAQIFNNIFIDSRKVWADFMDKSAIKPDVEYADYNHEEGTTLTSQRYEWRGINYSNAADLFADSGFSANDSQGDPLFTSRATNLYSLQVDSPALEKGVDGTDKGLYLAGIEKIGVAGIGK